MFFCLLFLAHRHHTLFIVMLPIDALPSYPHHWIDLLALYCLVTSALNISYLPYVDLRAMTTTTTLDSTTSNWQPTNASQQIVAKRREKKSGNFNVMALGWC